MTSTKCWRCNRGILLESFQQHRHFCDGVPLPADLAREFLDDDWATMYSLSIKHGAQGASEDVRHHVHFGLLNLGISRAAALKMARERSEKRMAARHTDSKSLIVKMPDPTSPDSRACERCEILTTARDIYGRPLCELCENDVPWRDALDIKEIGAV